jgi:hypothetical protein
MANLSPITTALFWSKVRVPHNQAECWEWQSSLNAGGYGRFSTNGDKISAHRLAYELVKGPIPEGLHIRHMCHNRLCCNPNHLDVGTPRDNAQDAIKAGRFSQGRINGMSKLTPADVVLIRQNTARLKVRDLARQYGVSAGTISNVKTGKIWRHV